MINKAAFGYELRSNSSAEMEISVKIEFLHARFVLAHKLDMRKRQRRNGD